MSGVLDTLGTSAMPQVFAALAGAGVVETMTIQRTAQSTNAMGGVAAGSVTTPYTSVPVAIDTDKTGNRYDAGGKPVSAQTYIMTFPTVDGSGALISVVLSTDKFIVDARSPFPARTYKIICPVDDMEVVNKFVCVRED